MRRERLCAGVLDAQRAEEVANVLDQHLRLFQGGKVPATEHLGPVSQVEDPLGPLAWRVRDVFWKTRDSRRDIDDLALL